MGVDGQCNEPAALPPGQTRAHCIRGWVDPRASQEGHDDNQTNDSSQWYTRHNDLVANWTIMQPVPQMVHIFSSVSSLSLHTAVFLSSLLCKYQPIQNFCWRLSPPILIWTECQDWRGKNNSIRKVEMGSNHRTSCCSLCTVQYIIKLNNSPTLTD